MSEPIVERIAQWLLTQLGKVKSPTYHQTLTVVRPLDPAGSAEPIVDLSCVLENGERGEAGKPTQTHRHKRQTFYVSVYLLGDVGGVAVDQRSNRVVADIERALAADVLTHVGGDTLCGGLAYRMQVGDPEDWIDRSRQALVVIIPIEVDYKVKITDPYSQ